MVWNCAFRRFHIFLLLKYTLSLWIWWVLNSDVTLVNRKIWVPRRNPRVSELLYLLILQIQLVYLLFVIFQVVYQIRQLFMLTNFTELHVDAFTFLFVVFKPVCPFVVRQLVKFLNELQLVNFVARGENHRIRFFHGHAFM